MRRRLALWICPDLRDEIAALQSGNVKCVLEREHLREVLHSMSEPMADIGDGLRYLRDAADA
jgi:hypothetical protein